MLYEQATNIFIYIGLSYINEIYYVLILCGFMSCKKSNFFFKKYDFMLLNEKVLKYKKLPVLKSKPIYVIQSSVWQLYFFKISELFIAIET